MKAARDHLRACGIRAALAGVIVVALIAVLYALLGPSSHRPASEPEPESYGTAPSYTLTDQHGRSFSSSVLRGRIQVVSYLFPYCTTSCPLTARMLAETEQLADRAGLSDRVVFVAFNVDPEGAGPAELSAFLRQEGISPDDPSWHYLTGGPGQIRRIVTDGFHVFYQKVSLAEQEKVEADEKAAGDYSPQPTQPNALADRTHVDYDVVHNDVIEIVDSDGMIRAVIAEGSGATPDEIITAVRDAGR
jgi:cytochrome oxidase Cu insertion factor (SCO1/SenC/PrrC family)